MPTDGVLPHITYQDVGAAIAWLTEAFGFTEHYRYDEPDGSVHGAQMYLGDAWIQLANARPGRPSPVQLGGGTQSVMVFVADVRAHLERARAAGAVITQEIIETEYGEREYNVEDLEGHSWTFSQHIQDVGPEDWGASVSNPLKL